MLPEKTISKHEIEELLAQTIPGEFGRPLIERSQNRLDLPHTEFSEDETKRLLHEIERTITTVFGPIIAHRIMQDITNYFEPLVIHEIYLIDNSGCLINHVSDRAEPGFDEHLMSGMFTAIQDFVRVSFKDRDDSTLRTLQVGSENVFISRGTDVYLTVIYSGHLNEEKQQMIKQFVATLEQQYKFETWDRNVQCLDGIEERIQTLLDQRQN